MSAKIPTHVEDKLIQTWLDNPFMKMKEIAERCGVCETTFWKLRNHDENFMAKYHAACMQRFNEQQALAIENLRRKLQAEDWQATKYTLDNTGYQASQKLDITANDIKITIED